MLFVNLLPSRIDAVKKDIQTNLTGRRILELLPGKI